MCPGTIATPMVTDMIDKGELDIAEAIAAQPINRLGAPDEIAAAVLWMCSPGASFVVGVALPSRRRLHRPLSRDQGKETDDEPGRLISIENSCDERRRMNMKLIMTMALLVAATASLSVYTATPAGAGDAMEISADESRPATEGSADTFTGQVSVKPLFNPNAVRTTGAAEVTFTPCARTAWHTHPAGQTLIATAGTGWIQQWGGQKLSIKPGDVIWTPPGVKHWHGATDTSTMTHIAIQDSVDGRPVDWLEHVTEEQYLN